MLLLKDKINAFSKEETTVQLDRIIAVRNSKTVFCDEGRCVKVFTSAYSKTDILREALNQSCAEEAGLSVPKFLEVTKIDGRWALISEYIEGKSLLRMGKEEPEKKSGYLNLFADLQLEIQKKCCPLPCSLKNIFKIRIDSAMIPEVVKEKTLLQLETLPEGNSLCHGDFYPSNVILREDKTPFVIDWSHAASGSPAADAAQSYLLFFLRDGKDTAEEYLGLYCKKSGAPEREIRAWLPVAAAAQCAKSNEGERAVLRSFIK